MKILSVLAYILLAPFIGGLITGIDRKISAWMQSRKGPPIWQPFYDVAKLWEKEEVYVEKTQRIYVFYYLLFIILSGAMVFHGDDLLLMIFTFTVASIFLVLAAYKGSSPYSETGAARELLQIMSYEPMVLLTAVGFYMVTNSFRVDAIASTEIPVIFYLPGVFFGFLYILTIKLRKSPFDLSTSHHAHQEIVKGITTEMSGRTLAYFEIAHWYETVLLLALVYLFFAWSPVLGIAVALVAYFLEILVDNTFARVKWQKMLWSSWLVALIAGFGNILVLYFWPR